MEQFIPNSIKNPIVPPIGTYHLPGGGPSPPPDHKPYTNQPYTNQPHKNQTLPSRFHPCAVCSQRVLAESEDNAATMLCLPSQVQFWRFENSPLRTEPLPNKVSSSSPPKSVEYKACLECRQKKKCCRHINPNQRKRNKPGHACVECKRLKRKCPGTPCKYCKTHYMDCQPQPTRTKRTRAEVQRSFNPIFSQGSEEYQSGIHQSPPLQEASPIMPIKSDYETMEMQSQAELSDASILDYIDSPWPQFDDPPVMPTSSSPCHGGPQCSYCVNGDYRNQSLVQHQDPSFANTHLVHNNPRPSIPWQQPLEVIATTAGSKETAQRRMSANIKLILLLFSGALTEYKLLVPVRNDEAFHCGEGLFGAAFSSNVRGCTLLRKHLEDQFVANIGDLEALSIICQLGTVLFKLFGICSGIYHAIEDSKLLSIFLENIQQCFQIELCEGCSCELNNFFKNDGISPVSRDILQGYLIWRILAWYNYVCCKHENCLGSGHGANLNGFAEKISGVLEYFLGSCGFSDIDFGGAKKFFL